MCVPIRSAVLMRSMFLSNPYDTGVAHGVDIGGILRSPSNREPDDDSLVKTVGAAIEHALRESFPVDHAIRLSQLPAVGGAVEPSLVVAERSSNLDAERRAEHIGPTVVESDPRVPAQMARGQRLRRGRRGLGGRIPVRVSKRHPLRRISRGQPLRVGGIRAAAQLHHALPVVRPIVRTVVDIIQSIRGAVEIQRPFLRAAS